MTQKPKQPEKKGMGCLVWLLIIIIITPVLLFGGFLFFATSELRQSDTDVLKSYKPTSEIADIAEKNALADKGKATFYRSNPTFVDADVFIKYCQATGVEALACNAPKPEGGPFGGRQIFLLQINDQRFIDHKYAAAVHEMLHTAYQRLSSDEKKQINALLDQELSKHQDDTYLMEIVDIVKTKKDGMKSVWEELHSKFGVEYSQLSPELEEYYKKYFNDRQKVVKLYKNGGFNSRVRRLDELKFETKSLNNKLVNMQGQLIAYKNSGDITNYNNLVSQYNSTVGQYNAKVVEAKKVYNEIQQFYKYFNPDYKPPEEKK